MTFLQSLIDGDRARRRLRASSRVGIGLVFGVMRLVNFAYGELITAGGYTLALPERPAGDRRDPRLLRRRRRARARAGAGRVPAAARRLAGDDAVATFAVSFLLQNVYLLAFGSRGSTVGTLGGLNTAIAIGSLRIRWITIVAVIAGAVAARRPDAAPEPDDDRPAAARGGGRLPHRAARSACAPTA